jgi:membrane protease YdiL (CAAX protease family)
MVLSGTALLWCYPLVGLGFAVLNAAMEEAVFRGIVMDALDRSLGDVHAFVGI